MNKTVGVGDMKVSDDPNVTLITYALGSCIGVTVWDYQMRVGGLLHFMLPSSLASPEKAATTPCVYADTGIARLLQECFRLGAQKGRLQVRVVGGAAMGMVGGSEDYFKIGKRNLVAVKQELWKQGVLITAQEVGGCDSRTMSMDIGTGQVTLRINGSSRLVELAAA